jgi:hypothetical protein
MFDFSKIRMIPRNTTGFKIAATDDQIIELEQHCGHTLPNNYKTILKLFNGGTPEAKYFNVIDPSTDLPGEWELNRFYYLDNNKEMPSNIWWIIERYSQFIGPGTLPFACDDSQQIYYIKWVNDEPQVWFLAYLDIEGTETCFLMNSFDELLEDLYAAE